MNIVIIEDELDAFKRLSKLVTESFKECTITHLDSLHSSLQWFKANRMPDIVFIDINLTDGTGFDVLNLVRIDCPYVITTAYDEYAIEAFKTNSIAYLLKPVTREDLQAALKKIQDYYKMFSKGNANKGLLQPKYKKRFVIRYGDYIRAITVEEIAYCYVQNGGTYVRTFGGRSFPLDYNLEMLQELLDPQVFFRINRQCLASLNSIAEIRTYSRGRIIVALKPSDNTEQVVSAERAIEFKQWLGGD